MVAMDSVKLVGLLLVGWFRVGGVELENALMVASRRDRLAGCVGFVEFQPRVS